MVRKNQGLDSNRKGHPQPSTRDDRKRAKITWKKIKKRATDCLTITVTVIKRPSL